MKPSTCIFISAALLLSLAEASRFYNMDTNTFSNYPGHSDSDNRLMAGVDFRRALNRGEWAKADSIYDDNGLDRLSSTDKLQILIEFVLSDKIDAIPHIMANVQLSKADLSDFFLLASVQSEEMLDLLVDRYGMDLNPANPYGIPLEPKIAALIAAKRG